MVEQASDFRDESEALHRLLERLDEEAWASPTQFKRWTVNDVIAHLHLWNYAACLTLRDADAFLRFRRELAGYVKGGGTHMAFTHAWLGGVRNRALLRRWRDLATDTAEQFAAADPKARVKWGGPDMSVRSCITARLMETWAHGQALYDLLGVERQEADRIRNVAVIGINTFGWTFANRGLDVPEAPHVRLTAPSGAVWEWHEPSDDNRIEGAAVDFCRVVTQVRNVADTGLRVTGEPARRWMALAQCFAGPPEDPPPPGSRFRRSSRED
ncbi:MAG: TIGR03084 family protein [Alphaproteobacteria bacterium]|nr:TIGR03084 family protein [Alphaproteobacteria bacterium]